MPRITDRTVIDATHRNTLAVLIACLVVLAATPASLAAEFDWAKKRAALGRQDKLRVLVDKVLSASNKWVMTPQFVQEIGDAGFNVVCPRVGCNDMKRVERVADMTRRRGLFYMAWMRGTLGTKKGLKLVWANGRTQDLYSPNADELWDWMSKLILGHARLSVANPSIVGSFLDFENYAKGKQGNCYPLSYDEKILGEFARAKGIDLPRLAPADRKGWLDTHGHHDAFRAFQIDSWRARCRKLRKQIDAINPAFQLIVYPVGTLFLNEAIYPEWSTERAPLIIADHCTYHRRGGMATRHAAALAAGKRKLEQNMQFAKGQGVPLLYTSGIDPIYDDADPEFCGRNAVMICDVCDGYWVFYEGPKYREDHPAYFEWFTKANRAIVAGEWDFWKQPRVTPDPVLAKQRKMLEALCGAKAKPYTTEPMPDDQAKRSFIVRTRKEPAVFCVLLAEGEELSGRLVVRRLGRYTAGAEYMLFNTKREKIIEGRAEIDRHAPILYKARRAGVHAILIDAGANPASLLLDNQHVCLAAMETLGLIRAQPPAYFLTEPGATSLEITVESPSPGETVAVVLKDPDGKQVYRADTVSAKKVVLKARVGPEHAGKPWRLECGQATKGGMEDFTITLGKGCRRLLATHPSRLLVRKE